MSRPSETKLQFEDATPLLENPARLRGKAGRDGFLFFKKFLPETTLRNLRRRILRIAEEFGWLREDRPLREGIVDPGNVRDLENWAGTGIPREAYLAVQKLEDFHALAHHPKLIALYGKLFDGRKVFPHPRNIARVTIPTANLHPTPPHQDFIHVQGTRNTWTCWFPLGDVPREMGSLSVLRGSHKAGVYAVREALGAGNLEAIIRDQGLSWVEGDFETGDLATFPSLTVHKALPHLSPDRIRLSCDFRYQPADEAIEERSLFPHGKVAAWETLYRGWTNKAIQYYWKDCVLEHSPWDTSLRALRT